MTIQEQSPPLTTVAYRSPDCSRSEQDRELVLLHLRGDPDAFSIIAENHYQELIVRARNLLGPYGEVEDAVQETFLRALRGLKQFGRSGEYRLGAWLNTILSNVCSDQRTRSSKDRLLAQSAGQELRDQGDVADQVSDPQTVETVKSAIQGLPPLLRSAFIRHELDEIPYAVLAEMENSSVELARARVHRAKSSLRQSLAGIESAAGGLISVPFLRSLRSRFVIRFTRGQRSTKVLGAGRRLNASLATPARVGRGGTSTLFGRLTAPVTSTSFGQSALALVTGTPRGTFMLGMAATVATVAATVATVSTTVVAPPVVTVAAISHAVPAADVIPAGAAGSVIGGQPKTADLVSTSTSTSGSSSSSTYGWVNAGTPADTSSGSGVTAAAAAGCSVPASIASSGSAASLGLANAVAVASATAVPLPGVAPTVQFSTDASLSSFGSAAAGAIAVTITTNACASSGSAWFSAQVTGLGTTAPLALQGTLVETIGSPGDLGYIFRGEVSPISGATAAASALLAGATQFVAQLEVAEPANTAQLTVVFLSPSAASSSDASSAASATGDSSTTTASSTNGSSSPQTVPATSGSTTDTVLTGTWQPLPLVTTGPTTGSIGTISDPTVGPIGTSMPTLPWGLSGGGSGPNFAASNFAGLG